MKSKPKASKQKSNTSETQSSKSASSTSSKSQDIWNIKDTLGGQSFEALVKELKSKSETFMNYRKLLNNKLSVDKFLEILKFIENIHVIAVRLNAYCELKSSENTKDADALAKASQLKQISSEISNNIMFFTLWFMHLDDSSAKTLMSAKQLEPYNYYLEEVRRLKAYTKSEEIEKLLNIKDTNGLGAFSELYEIITNGFNYQLNGKTVTEEELRAKVVSQDPKERKDAYDKILKKFSEHSTILSEIYKDIAIEWYNDGVKIRGYKNSINIRNVSNDVTDKSVEVLMRVVRQNVKVFNEYFKLKYKINTQNGQKYPYSRYHLYAPFPLKLTKKYTYEESKQIVLETFKEFDMRFYNNALKVLNSGHIHSHPKQDKRSGAFCAPMHNKIVPYVMLNHTDTLRDVFTLIHELGHAMHYLFAENCTNLTYHAGIPVAETASVFSEMLLSKKLLRECKTDAEKQYILIQLLDNQFATVIRQTYFTIFEQYAHTKVLEGIDAEVLNTEWYNTLKEQFGDMEIPESFKNEWLYVSHFFNQPFYCYGYAWGNLLVLALFDMYTKENGKFIDKYIKLLSAGGSKSPMTLLKELNIDPESEEFWQRGFNTIKEEIEQLRKLAK